LNNIKYVITTNLANAKLPGHHNFLIWFIINELFDSIIESCELTPLIHCSTNRLKSYVQRHRPLDHIRYIYIYIITLCLVFKSSKPLFFYLHHKFALNFKTKLGRTVLDNIRLKIVLELDFRAVKFLFFPRRDLNPHHWCTAAPFA
jgi:hypothetical protein